ncbi:MAG: hypothetical protein C4331_00195 [Meiothermus sp.]
MNGIFEGLILAAAELGHVDAHTMQIVGLVVGVMTTLGGAVVGSVAAVLVWKATGSRLNGILVGIVAGSPMGAIVGFLLGSALSHIVGSGAGALIGLLGGAIGGFIGSGLGTTGKVLS